MGILEAKVAFVFPGQGSQCVGMGKDFAEKSFDARSRFAEANAILGFPLSDMCCEGSGEELTDTLNAQPALFTVGAIACDLALERGLKPSFVAGHSVGEYAALYAARALTFEDGLRLVRTRAELMQNAAQAQPGTMAAILGLASEQVLEAVAEASSAGIVVAANFNSPVQTVISGEAAAVARASEIAICKGAKRVVHLNVSGGFHSPLMQSASDGLTSALARTPVSDCRIPVAANFTGEFETLADQVHANLAAQMVSSVRWVECVEVLVAAGVEVFVELGPGNVLAGLVKRIAKDVTVVSVGDIAGLDAALSA